MFTGSTQLFSILLLKQQQQQLQQQQQQQKREYLQKIHYTQAIAYC
jgi:hypothetical protein